MSREMGRLILEVNKLMSKRGLLLNELKQIENGCDVGRTKMEILLDLFKINLEMKKTKKEIENIEKKS